MSYTAAVEVRAQQATVVGFLVESSEENLPMIWECPQPDCDVIVTMSGLRIVRAGHVTCLRCLRPMHLLAGVTVH